MPPASRSAIANLTATESRSRRDRVAHGPLTSKDHAQANDDLRHEAAELEDEAIPPHLGDRAPRVAHLLDHIQLRIQSLRPELAILDDLKGASSIARNQLRNLDFTTGPSDDLDDITRLTDAMSWQVGPDGDQSPVARLGEAIDYAVRAIRDIQVPEHHRHHHRKGHKADKWLTAAEHTLRIDASIDH